MFLKFFSTLCLFAISVGVPEVMAVPENPAAASQACEDGRGPAPGR